MDDVVAVQVADAADHLSEVEGGEVLLEVVLLADLLEEAAVGGQFQQQVDLVGVVEEAVHLEDVGVVGVELDLDLLHQLRLHACRTHLRLADHLYRAGEASARVPAHVDVAELAAPQLPPHLEHAQAQLFCLVVGQHAAEV